MKRYNLYELKANLSRYIEYVREGETIIVCKRNVPVAEIRPIKPRRTEKRKLGQAEGEFTVPESFYEPLDEETLASFEAPIE